MQHPDQPSAGARGGDALRPGGHAPAGHAAAGPPSSLRTMPLWPLAATLAVQTLATMSLFSVPAVAPAIAAALGVSGALVGVFVSLVYTVGIVSALVSPGFIHRFGATRITQVALLAVFGLLAIGAGGTLVGLAVGAVVLGLAYGSIAPASTHLLVPNTPRSAFNMVMSLRQIGVPLGGVLGAVLLPPITLALGWRWALLVQIPPVLALMLLMELPRRRWDHDRSDTQRLFGRTLLLPFQLLRDGAIRRLSVASFVYSGTQLCFVAFMTVHLTTTVGFDLVRAGQVLATYQVFGAVSRPIWGWIADKWLTPAQTLAVHGLGMALAALAAGRFGPAWPHAAILLVAAVAGCTAAGYTGVAYADFAALGGARRTEATGLGTAVMFAGVTLMPPAFSALATGWGYPAGYEMLAVCSLIGAVMLVLPRRQ
ncbi:MAG: MFS transporter [Rhodospirillales bacterium]|nr:MFS transporter [Rhodospirillales bacterium]